jgi:Response regulator containing CheY-like receiver, AAA-type ATPase, and DNA-binding domains
VKIKAKGVSLVGHRILVIEDDETLRDVLLEILAELGADCESFTNAEDGLVHLLEQHGEFDLVIADHGVPGSIKGMELAEMIHEKWPALPVLLTSGSVLDLADLAPPLGYLFKPWSIPELTSVVRSLLSAR